ADRGNPLIHARKRNQPPPPPQPPPLCRSRHQLMASELHRPAQMARPDAPRQSVSGRHKATPTREAARWGRPASSFLVVGFTVLPDHRNGLRLRLAASLEN
ncbi:hypothetical protein, partial [Mycobacteroides abscessus]|uniref:hypothetical protein n=1 Tax=Mycobacteroides abscessus TaxID=36809 RepID=UPI001A9692E8